MVNSFGNRLKEARNNRGLTQPEVADYIDVALRTYQCYEQGTRHPSFESLIMLSNLFGVTVDWLLDRGRIGTSMVIASDTVDNSVIDGRITLTNSSTFSALGMIKGDVVIENHSTLDLSGMFNGTLTVDESSCAIIHGMADLQSIKSSGVIEVFGTIKCPSNSESSLTIHQGAIVNGKRCGSS